MGVHRGPFLMNELALAVLSLMAGFVISQLIGGVSIAEIRKKIRELETVKFSIAELHRRYGVPGPVPFESARPPVQMTIAQALADNAKRRVNLELRDRRGTSIALTLFMSPCNHDMFERELRTIWEEQFGGAKDAVVFWTVDPSVR